MAGSHLERGRRSKGGSIGLRRIVERARKSGRTFERPPLPPALTPEQRADWDDFIFPKIKSLPTYPEIAPYIGAVEDYWRIRKGLHAAGKTAKDEDALKASFQFGKDHPELERDNAYGKLKPAFDIITGRFEQVAHVMNARKR